MTIIIEFGGDQTKGNIMLHGLLHGIKNCFVRLNTITQNHEVMCMQLMVLSNLGI